MEQLRSLWSQHAMRTRGSNRDYALLDNSPDSSDRESELSNYPEPKVLANPHSIIIWQTSPTFAVSINLLELLRISAPLLLFLLPSFLRPRSNNLPRKLYPTSYLDGLRGVAALFVVIHHYAYTFTSSSLRGWHAGPEGSHNWFFQLPLIRVIHSGRFMVTIFFVISGYVLSYRSLRLAREGKLVELLDSLASSVFRRWLRLHLPVIASTFIAFLAARGNLWTEMHAGWEHDPPDTYLYPKPVPLPVPQGTFTEQLSDWYRDTHQLCDPFRYGAVTASAYNINILWTIPVEWMGSMLVFITVLGIARMQTWTKFCVLLYLFYYCHASARWEPATFLVGILLAELSFIKRRSSIISSLPNAEPSGNSKESGLTERAGKLLWTIVFLVGLYIGSHPQESPSSTPGYQTLMSLLPTVYTSTGKTDIFWPAIGSVIVIFALENAPHLQSLFTTPVAQYLGDISFSLYILHTMVLCTLGTWLAPRAMNLTGGWSNGQTGFIAGIVLVVMVTGPVTLWVSDVYSRGVDEKCVKFARWVGDKCFVKLA